MKALLKASLLLLPYMTCMADPYGTSAIRVVPVERTPESDAVMNAIVFPRDGEMKESNPVKVQIRIEGFPLGIDSPFRRQDELTNDDNGQAVHVLIDNYHYVPEYEDIVDALNPDVVFFQRGSIIFEIPFDLKPGLHVIRAFPVRTFYESLKGDYCFAVSTFYLQNKENPQKIDLSKPYLTYNEPTGVFSYAEHKPILLDFYVTNCRLSADGYKVKFMIDGHTECIITRWVPHYIYGLAQGTHKIRIQLLDARDNLVPGPFNDVEETIVLE